MRKVRQLFIRTCQHEFEKNELQEHIRTCTCEAGAEQDQAQVCFQSNETEKNSIVRISVLMNVDSVQSPALIGSHWLEQ
jgi:hypothetical protein